MGRKIFWVGVPPPLRRRPPPSRHVPLVHPAAGRDERRSGPVHGPSRPRSVSVVGWVTAPARPRSRRTHRLGRVTRPSARLRAAGRAQPRAGGSPWMGLDKRGKDEERVRRSSECRFHLSSFLRCPQGSHFGCGPVRYSNASAELPYSG